MSYLRDEVLYLTVCGLVSDRPLRERLESVAIYMFPRVANKFDDEPVLKGRMMDILNRLSSVMSGPEDDGNISATIKRLSDPEVKAIADDLVGLAFDEIRRLEGEEPIHWRAS
jgi:hypothetical protein